LKEECGISSVISYEQKIYERVFGLILSLINGSPLQVGYFFSFNILKWSKRYNAEYDVGVFHMMRAAKYAKYFNGKIKIFEMCDANSEIFRQNVTITKWYQPWHWISKIESKRAIFLEKNALKDFDLLTLHTLHDAKIISPDLNRILISTQGVKAIQENFISPTYRFGHKIAFIGKIDFHPNLDAVNWFIEFVLPKIPPHIEFKIIGSISKSLTDILSHNPRVQITGAVDSISDATQDCFLGIAPMRSAAGIQNKVLDYFSLGLPVITNKNVLKGLLSAAENCVIQAESPNEWVCAINNILNKKINIDELTKSAFQYINENHNWEIIGKNYSDRIKKIEIKT
jgi:glycosyltransferase involved in cell wall biosynthesis